MSEREHPADALLRLFKEAGHEADPEALAEIRAVCDAPVDTTRPHDALIEWTEREYQRVIESKVVTAVCSSWAASVRAGEDPRAENVCLDEACPIHKVTPQ